MCSVLKKRRKLNKWRTKEEVAGLKNYLLQIAERHIHLRSDRGPDDCVWPLVDPAAVHLLIRNGPSGRVAVERPISSQGNKEYRRKNRIENKWEQL